MSITDLTNTTWKFTSVECEAGYGEFDVRLGPNDDRYYFAIGYLANTMSLKSIANTVIQFYINIYNGCPYPCRTFEVGDPITFYGGEDVTNPDLISYITTHAIQIIKDESEETPIVKTVVDITYNDTVIATVKPNQTATIQCTNKKMLSDLKFSAKDSPFTFIIDSRKYYFEEGMTWEEWCDSEYNTHGYYIETNTEISSYYNKICLVISGSKFRVDTGYTNGYGDKNGFIRANSFYELDTRKVLE